MLQKIGQQDFAAKNIMVGDEGKKQGVEQQFNRQLYPPPVKYPYNPVASCYQLR